MHDAPFDHATFVTLLTDRAARHPERVALRLLADGEHESEVLTYGELHARASVIAAALLARCAPGERALLLFPSGVPYVTAFLGCLYAGVVAVPAYPPASSLPQHRARVLSIVRDAAPALVLTTSALAPGLRIAADELGLSAAQVLASDALPADAALRFSPPPLSAASLAFLQYTSGSTSSPKGVMVGHGCLLANEASIRSMFELSERDVVVSWLPLFHDMGLIGCLLQPLYSGASLVLMAPQRFLERPLRWLQAVSRFGGTVTGGPNFAYRMCAQRLREAPAEAQGLDLSSLRLAFCGAEPIRAATMRELAEAAAPYGLRANALYPCYGLAEATLLVTGAGAGRGVQTQALSKSALRAGRAEAAADGDLSLVACGQPGPGHRVEIVDPERGDRLPEGRLGEIQVAGPSVALGYFRNPEATRETFVERDGQRFLRTGDLGFLYEGQLYVTGRLKDLIILRGQNLYPEDLEACVEREVEVAVKGRVAVFALDDGEQESFAVALEIQRHMRKWIEPRAVCEVVQDVVSRIYQEVPAEVLLLPQGALPLTSSGKLMRGAAARLRQRGELDVFHEARAGESGVRVGAGAGPVTQTEHALTALWQGLLGRSELSRERSFFALGGNSLKAAQLVAQVRAHWGVELPLRALFDAPTLPALAAAIDAAQTDGAAATPAPLPRAPRSERMPLSAAEARLWFLYQLAPDDPAYNLTTSVSMQGPLPLPSLARALSQLLERHPQLRARYAEHDGEPARSIDAPPPLALRAEDLCAHADPEAEAERRTRALALRPFVLEQGGLVRFMLLRVRDSEHRLVLCAHHIIVDGLSLDILWRELLALLRAELEGTALPAAPALEYADWTAWERGTDAAEQRARALEHFRQQLGTEPLGLALPRDHVRPAGQPARSALLDFELPTELGARVERAALALGVTPFMFMLAVFSLLLSRYSGESRVRVGVPVARRSRAELADVVGLFVDTQVLQTDLSHDPSFRALAAQVRDVVLAAHAHERLTFDELVRALAPARRADEQPLFQVMLSFRPRVESERATLGELTLCRTPPRDDVSKFELTLHVNEWAGRWQCRFCYDAGSYEHATIERFERSFRLLLEQAATRPERRISQLAWFSEHELPAAAVADSAGVRAARVHDVIAAWAARTPDAIAVRDGARTLSYAALEWEASLLAAELAARGVGTEARVALVLPRAASLVVALYGVLRAGAAYVPLDPKQPAARLAQLVADSGASLVLTLTEHAALLGQCAVPVLALDQPLPAASARVHAAVPAQALAYVIYTSGSTGTPKGVGVSHAALLSYTEGLLSRLALPTEVRSMAMVSSVAADLGHTALFGALCSGRTVHLLSEELAFDPDAFADYMAREGVDVLKIVPSHIEGLLAAERPERVLPRHMLVLGGEACSAPLLEKLEALAAARGGQLRIVNHYGPTETTVGVASCEHAPQGPAPLPLGAALPGRRIYVLSPDLTRLPVGVAGEIYVAGEGLARGYLARPGATAERFLPDPFGARGSRMYRTGDRGRVDGHGQLVFLGRVDEQVKLRGHRVELGEVRAALCALPGVADAQLSVDRTEAGAQRLLAYVIASEPSLEVARLQSELSERLPHYMVPSEIVQLERFPVTSNGKLDRAALPIPARSEAGYEAPRGELEAGLQAVWQAVLRVPRVGRHDNFFVLGGDSILTLQVVARARKAGLAVTAKQLFERQTIAELAEVVERTAATESARSAAPRAPEPRGLPRPEDFPLAGLTQAELEALPVPPSELEDVFPLSPMQQGMLLHTLLEPGSGIYLMQDHYHIDSAIDPERFVQAWQQVIARHAALRASFVWQNDQRMLQLIARQLARPAVFFIDHSDLAPAEQEAAIAELLRVELAQGYDLARAPLLQLRLFQLGPARFRFVLSRHHILMDAWCRSLLLVDFFAIYRGLVTGQEPELADPPPYRDFIAWLGTQDRSALCDYWQRELAGFDAATPLAIDRPLSQAAGRSRVCDERCELSEVESALLTAAAKRLQVTPNTLCQAAWSVVLSQYSGHSDVVFGVTVAGRPPELPGIEETVGLFINTLPLRVRLPQAQAGVSIGAWLKQLQAHNARMRQHEQLPLVEIQSLSRVARGQALFHSLFVYENAPLDHSLAHWGELFKVRFGAHRTHTNYPLTVVVVPGDRPKLIISFDGRMFEPADVRRMLLHFKQTVLAMARAPERAPWELPGVSPAEAEAQARANDTARSHPLQAGYAALFRQSVAARPLACAVRAADEAVSYAALDARSERVGVALQAHGLAREDVVAVLCERGVPLIASAIGIFKAGGAYLPLDPQQPVERLAQIVALARPRALLCSERVADVARKLLGQLPEANRPRLCGYEAALASRGVLRAVPSLADQLAYVIYTSGSTGTPKGAMVTQAGMLNNQLSKLPYLELSDTDVVAQTAVQSFDISVWQLLAALLCGGTVEIVPDEIAHDALALLAYVRQRGISVLQSVPSLISAMLCEEAPATLGRLRWLLPTGEALPPELCRRWLQRYPGVPLVNAYGPAECADDVALHMLRQAPAPEEAHVPIGRPTDNTRLYVLDADLQRVAQGVSGEICVAGVGVGRGYLADPARTAEAFVPHPFGAPGERLYRTGDLGRYRADGSLEYVGRRDQQVKIRGYRIELGEIEARLREQPGVREAVVLARQDVPGQKRLVAYLVRTQLTAADAQTAPERDDVRAWLEALKQGLAQRLPEYMVPQQCVVLPALPRLDSGKVDRKALPAPDMTSLQRAYAAPETELERALAAIWAQTLRVPRVGLDDDFFELGGDSILALQVVGRARKLGIGLVPRQVLSHSSLRALAACAVVGTDASTARPAVAPWSLVALSEQELRALPVPREQLADAYPLSPMQQGMLVHTLLEPGSGIYLMQEHFSFDTALDEQAFRSAWEAVVARHEQLRVSFTWDEAGRMLQLVHAQVPSPVELLDFSHLPEAEHAGAIEQLARDEQTTGFDLTQPRLFRVRLIRLTAERYYFIKSYHHMLLDGWCSSLLLVEFFARYRALTEGAPLALPTPPPYREFIGYLARQDRDRALDFWRESLAGLTEATPLGVERPLPADAPVSRVAEEVLYLSESEVQQILSAAQQSRVTPNTVAQAAWAVLLSQYSGADDVTFGVTVAGRPPEIEDSQLCVGLFINTIPLRTQLPAAASETTVCDYLQALLAQNLRMRQHEHVPLVDIQRLTRIPRGQRLFHSLLVFENAPLDASLMTRKYQFRADLTSHRTHTNYPLTVVIVPGPRWKVFLSYDCRLLSPEHVRRMLEQFRRSMLEMADAPQARLRALSALSDAELAEQEALHPAPRAYPLDAGYAALFAEQRHLHAERLAVRAGNVQRSYAELDADAERVGHALRAAGVGPEDRVALALPRGAELIAAILGVWKVAGVYLPLDTRLPERRSAQLLALARPALIVTQRGEPAARVHAALSHLPSAERPSVLIYEELGEVSAPLPSARVRPDQLAYVIYTSGSTGTPKGAMVTSAGMLNNQLSKLPYLGLGVHDVLAQTAAVSFDISVWQLTAALLCGASVEVVPDEIARDAQALLGYVAERGITVLQSVPSLISAMLADDAAQDVGALRVLLPTGEALTPELCRRWFARHPGVPLVNAYGPAECADDVALHRLERAPSPAELSVPIGTATDNTRLYVLDRCLQRVPLGVTGEICVAGVGVGRGYLGDPARTAQAFVPHPFGAPGERLYRTGDLGRLRADGSLEFVGRRDQQIKLRGYRIELGEIEARLHEEPGVTEAAVLVREDAAGHPRLVAYYAAHAETTEQTLRDKLSDCLPEYMVPRAFVRLPVLPKLHNGKLDRNALPHVELAWEQRPYVAPQTAMERALAGVWQQTLGVAQVGLDDDFFELGGDSIIALQLVGRAKGRGIRISVRQVFAQPRLGALAAVAEALATGEVPAPVAAPSGGSLPLVELTERERELLPVPLAELEDVYPLSPMQQGMLLHTLLEPGSGIYLMQEVYHFDHAIDPQAFAAAWDAVVARHAQLRTTYLWQAEGRMLQLVHRQLPSVVEYLDWSAQPERRHEAMLSELVKQELERGYDLARGPLLRMRLVRCSDQSYYFVESYHHILIDGWCSSLILTEFFARYHALVAGEALQLPPDPPAYRDFIAWLGQRDRSLDQAYFREQLAGFRTPTPLVVDRKAALPGEVSRVHELIVHLSAAETQQLARAAVGCQVTPNTLAQAAWALLLSQYSGQRDVLFGVTVAGRPTDLDGVQDTVGLFINTLPLRVKLPARAERAQVRGFLQALLAQNLAMRQHEHVPLVEIQAAAEVPRGRRLFDSLLVFENAPLDRSLFEHKFELRAELTSQRTHTNYPLTVVVTPGEQVELRFSYDTRLFEAADVERMLAHYRELLLQLACTPDRSLWSLPYLSAAERTRLDEGNQTARTYPLDAGYAQLFAAQVREHASRTAVSDRQRALSYAALDREAETVAHALLDAGLQVEDGVAVLMARSCELVASIVGVLKAGGVYLPLDPALPVQRMAQIVQLAGARVLLTTHAAAELSEALLAQLPAERRPQLRVLESLPAREQPVRLRTPHAQQLAYVIYTSGSSGTPKGAMVTLQGMLNNQLSKLPYLGLTPGDVVAQTASQSFDISVWQLLAALLCGARVEVVEDDMARDAAALLGHVRARGITVLESVPSLIEAMLHADGPAELGKLRWLLPTGEALPPALARRWQQRYPAVPLVNAYGPAECADDVALHVVPALAEAPEINVPVGRPTDNTRLYVLDAALERVAPGVIGEICVAGVGVGRGYLGDPARTAEVFIPDPYGPAGARLYRTGDLGRFRTDGCLEFVGRRDQQVKVRGFRIELQEIEARLRDAPSVQDVAVIAHADAAGHKRLVAYVVSSEAADFQAEQERLRKRLGASLPEYMVPQLFVCLPTLPKLDNGKLDRNALPAVDPSLLTQRPYVAPSTGLQAELAALWASTLGVARVGLDDDFFELGGDSILALQLVGRAKAKGLRLSAREVLAHPSVRAQSELLAKLAPGPRAYPSRELAVGEVVPMTPIQHWFFEQRLANPHHWNQSVLLFIPPAVDVALLERALGALVLHHDAFRLRFERDAHGVVRQWVAAAVAAPLEHIDLRAERDPAAALLQECERAQRSLHIERGPLVRLVHFSAPDAERLLVVLHHLISDTVSLRILFEDLQHAYAQLRAGEAVSMPDKTSSFADWTRRLQRHAESPELQAELGHWSAVLGSALPDLPARDPGGDNKAGSEHTLYAYLSVHETTQLLRLAPLAYQSEITELLLTALAETICAWAGHPQMKVEIERHGREDLFDGLDVSRTVGWFSAPQMALLSPALDDPEASIAAVRGQLRAAPHRGFGYGLTRYLTARGAELRAHPLPQVFFNYLGQFDQMLRDADWLTPSYEPRGEERCPDSDEYGWFGVGGAVEAGRMRLEWRYSDNLHDEDTARSLLADYAARLRRLIAHCVEIGSARRLRSAAE